MLPFLQAAGRVLRWSAKLLASFLVGWIGGSLLLLALSAFATQLLVTFLALRFR